MARTGTDIWKLLTGPEVHFPLKEPKTLSNHSLRGIWEDNPALQIYNILDSMREVDEHGPCSNRR